MLSSTHGDNMEVETVVSLSKAEILREIIVDKLSTAAQEIFAVVERTVAVYEEEASGFRLEIDRQRKQLEVVLHPEIKVETTDDEQQFSFCEPVREEAAGGGRELSEDEEQHKYEPSWGFLSYPEEQTDEDEEGEESRCWPVRSSTQDLTNYKAESRLLPPSVQTDRSGAGRHWIREPLNHVELRIRILEDSQIEVLSTTVFKKYPVHELHCPRGLQEAGFLNLLRSTFPQLAPDKPFDVCITDKTRKLRPLKANALTPEEICRIIRTTGAGNSALYIRLKAQEEPKATNAECRPSQGECAVAESPSTPHQTSPHTGDQSDIKKRARSRSRRPQTHVDLKIRVLDDPHIDILTPKEFRKYPMKNLKCPLDLHEANFLNLLWSTFPQLAADQPFDMLTIDYKKRLHLLNLSTLTPDEIYRTMKSTGSAALFIRLKAHKEPKATNEVFHLLPREHAAADSPSSSNTGDQSDIKKRDRSRSHKPQTCIDLRIRILEDPEIDVVRPKDFKKLPFKDMRLPLGLHEDDFLNLLRSSFPQLAEDQPFDIFTIDNRKRLHPLIVNTLRPEEIYETIRSTGAGYSALYIRLKSPEGPPAKKKHHSLQNKAVAAVDSPSIADLSSGIQSVRKKPGRRSINELQNHVDLKIRVLEDSHIDVLSSRVFKKYPLQELQCPLGLQEADFLQLLKSTFPQLAADQPFAIFTTDRSRRLHPLKLNALTPEEIHRNFKSSRFCAIYIQPKAQEEACELKVDAAKYSPSTSDESRLHNNIHVQHKLVHTVENLSLTSTPQQDTEAEGINDESASLWSLASLLPSESEKDEGESSHTDDDWKPNRRDAHLRTGESETSTKIRQGQDTGIKATTSKPNQPPGKATSENGDYPLSCKVCRALRGSVNIMVKHAWSHVDESERLCGVCGEHLESADDLRNHLQRHLKTHSCNICGKSFVSITGLKGHVARHKEQRPHECKVCRQTFANKSDLASHRLVHAINKPYKCDICQKACVSMGNLKRHMAVTHTNKKLYTCNTCMKHFLSLESLSEHLSSHSGHVEVRQRAYVCEICSRRFYTNRRLQLHLKYHNSEESRAQVCKKCNKPFLSRAQLVIHMRVHTGEKPFKCSVCDRAFSQKHCVKRHLKTHMVEKTFSVAGSD